MIWIFLVRRFMEKSNEELNISVERVSSSLSSLLHSYYWPGNIRELANTVESAMNMTQDGEDTLDVHHLPLLFENHFKREISAMPNAMQVFSHPNHTMKLYDNYPVMDFHSDLSTMVGQYEKIFWRLLWPVPGGTLPAAGKVGHHPPGVDEKVQKYHIDLAPYKRRRQT